MSKQEKGRDKKADIPEKTAGKSPDQAVIRAYHKRVNELLKNGDSDRLDRALTPRKYDTGTYYLSPEGRRMAYNKTNAERTVRWMEANREQLLISLEPGIKAVLKEGLPDPKNEKMGPYLIRLAAEDILRRVQTGQLDPNTLLETYHKSADAHLEKIRNKQPDNPFIPEELRTPSLIKDLETLAAHKPLKEKPPEAEFSDLITGEKKSGPELAKGFFLMS